MLSGTNVNLSYYTDQDAYGKVTPTQETHNKQEIQGVNFFPTGDHKAERNRQGSTTKANTKHETQTTKTYPQMKHHLETVSKTSLGGGGA